MDSIIELSVIQLSLAYLFVVVLFFLLKSRGIKREWELFLYLLELLFHYCFSYL